MSVIEWIDPGKVIARNTTGPTPPDLLGISVVLGGLGLFQLGLGLLAFLLPPSTAIVPIVLQFLVPGIVTVLLAIGTFQRRPIAWVAIAGGCAFVIVYTLITRATVSISRIANVVGPLFTIAYLVYRRDAFFS